MGAMEHGVPETTFDASTCSRCGGTGWVIEDDEGVGAARRCSCQQSQRNSRLLAAAGIPKHYHGCRLSRFKASDPNPDRKAQLLKALQVCRHYLEKFETFVEEDGGFHGTGLLFIGPPGGGKTHLAVAVLIELIERLGVRGRFVELTALVKNIQGTFETGASVSRTEILDPLLEAQVLVLDELGAQKLTPFVQDLLYLLINHRYTRRLPTLFTTNFRLKPGQSAPKSQNLDRGPDPKEDDRFAEHRYGLLSHRLPPMLISRLYEMAMPVVLDKVSDYRQDILSAQTRV